MFAAGPTPVALTARINIKRGAVIVVEWAKGFESGADAAQVDVGADDIDDVVCLFDPLFQGVPIFAHGAPADETRQTSRPRCETRRGGAGFMHASRMISIGV
jgi:hypothetical protein